MKRFFKFIFSRLLWVNLLLAVLITLIIILAANIFLHRYTEHGKSCVVPDLVGMKESEVKDVLSQLNLNYVIVDSIHTENVELGAIAEQVPHANFNVKNRRTIYLVKNADLPEMVKIPNIKEITLRRAKSTLEAYGFELGKLEYVPDVGVNVVLRIKHNGSIIEPGNELLKGSVVDLVLGQGLSDDKTHVPNVEGLAINAAVSLLNDKFLNVGAVIYADDVKNEKDSMNAKIYKQYPAFDTLRNVNLGFSVDLWLTADTAKIPKFVSDSVLMDSLRNMVELPENED